MNLEDELRFGGFGIPQGYANLFITEDLEGERASDYSLGFLHGTSIPLWE